jgi:MSHA biogenesis protein MshQ
MSEGIFFTYPKKIITSLFLLCILFWTATAATQEPESCPTQNVGDNFPSISYSQNSGSTNWSGEWTEVGESNGTNSGIARVRNDLCTDGYCLRLGVPSGNRGQTYSNIGVYRETDLNGASNATLSFVYRRGVNQGSQTVILSVSNNGGSSWTELQRYFMNRTNTSPVSASFDITAYAASDTQIRFLASGNNAVIGMYIDDIDISYQPTCTPIPQLDYHFDELTWNGAPDEVLDYSLNNHNGTALGGIRPASGKVCNAANIPSNTSASTFEAVDTGADLDTIIGSKGTISLWYKGNSAWNSGTDKRLFDATDGNKYFFGEIGSDGRVKFWFEDGDDGDYQQSTVNALSVGANVWKYLTFTWDVSSNTAQIYVDGVAQPISGELGGTTGFSGYNTLYFGDNRNTSYFPGQSSADGLIDEALVFNSVLTTTQIQTIFSNQDSGLNYDGSARACPPSPLIKYHFDELSWNGSLGEVFDSSSNSHDATSFNTSVTNGLDPAISGNTGTCRYGQFNGIDDYVQLPSSFPDLTGSITISAWINATDLNSGSRIFIDDENNTQGFGFSLGDGGTGKLRLFSRAITPISVDTRNAVISTNNWYFVAAVHDVTAKTIRVYVDGVAQILNNGDTVSTYTGTWGTDDGPASIGGETNQSTESGASFHFNGAIDEPRIYSTALTAAEISTLMNETRTCPSAPIEYRFDELSWKGNSEEVLDSSSIGLNGSAVGDTATIASGQVCRAGTFDGTADYIDVNGIDSYLNTNASLSFWIKSSQLGSNTAWQAPGIIGVEQRGGEDDIFWGYLDASGFIRIQKGNGTSAVSSTLISDDNWHHVVLTRNTSSGVVQVYVDGNLEDSASSTTGNVGGIYSSIGRIENSYSNLNFNGQLDEVLIFNSVLSASYVNTIYNNQSNGNNYDGTARVCPANPLDHFEIHHDGNGFTCEAETVTIKACANEDCSIPYTEPVSITLSPSEWAGGDTITFGNAQGEITTTLSVTDETTITLAKTNANPEANLRCFIGGTETCDITFSNDGFEIYGANIGDSLPDQLAADNFFNVNVRAVRSVDNVCEALLEGPQEITLSYNCDSPNQCLTPLNIISIDGDGTGENSGNINVEFNDQGVASLALLKYPDAGRLNLSVAAVIEGVTFNHSDQEPVDVYPSYLALSVVETELLYGSSGTQNNYVAGESFTVVIGAYGTNDNLLPNYQAENPQLKVRRVSPSSSGENGTFKYSDSGTKLANTSAAFTNTSGLSFSDGEHRYALANYTEVGRIEIDVQDADYLGNEITFDGEMTLGDFYPAYFDVALTEVPTLADTCNNIFSYLGQNINFETSPEFTLTAYNALGTKTLNYSDTYWNYQPNKPTVASLSFIDSSTFSADDSATVINLGDTPVIANNDNYDGSGTVTINNGSFRYNKVDPADQSIFAAVSPFDAKINLEFSSDFFNSSFVDQNGIQDIICYKAAHSDNTCLGWDINDVIGTQIRYGRLVLESTYGPETEPLNVPIKTEYFNASQWLLNTDDSNCTSIDFTEDNNEIQLSDTSFADSFNSVTSTGVLIKGVAVGNQFTLDAPNTTGELDIWLDPTALDVTWPAHLNYDWNGDGFINTDDFPEATVNFGLFRGNDRIIHWREVFN